MSKKVRKAVFPAAGLGTRFLPATKASPKEMLTLVDKPLIQYSVEEAVASGIESILIITGRDKSSMEDHFDISYELEQVLKERGKDDLLQLVRSVSELAKISYTRQGEALGLGHAIYQAKDFAADEPFAALLPDDVIDAEKPALKQMIEVFEKYDAPVIATMQIAGEAISRFGVIDAEEVEPNVYRIRDMVEKPPFAEAPSELRHYRPVYLYAGHLRGDRTHSTGSGRRDTDNRRYAAVIKGTSVLCRETRRHPPRRGRQTGFSHRHGRVCFETR